MWTTSSASVERRVAASAVGHVGRDERSARRPRPGSAVAGSTSSPAHLGPARGQSPADRAADEAAGPGDRGLPTLEASGRISRSRPSLYSPRLAQDRMAPPPEAPSSAPPGGSAAAAGARVCRLIARAAGPPAAARPAAVTIAAAAAGPFALAVLRPAPRPATSPLFALQMWAFIVVHELPYDDPERLERRAPRRLPDPRRPRARARRAPERPPAARLLAPGRGHRARPRARLRPLGLVPRAASRAGVDPVAARSASPRAARQMARGLRPRLRRLLRRPHGALRGGRPSRDHGGGARRRGAEIVAGRAAALRRVMVEVGEKAWGRAWPALYESLGGNPWAAMPSLHFAHLGAGGDPALGGEPAGRRLGLGIRADARLRARRTWASTT